MYTIEVFKRDRRTKRGQRLVFKEDYATDNRSMLEHTVRQTWPPSQFRVEIYETFVVRRNAQTGEEFRERYDTPWACSPSSETYWSS